jgi:hypothetical protein
MNGDTMYLPSCRLATSPPSTKCSIRDSISPNRSSRCSDALPCIPAHIR